MKRPTLAGTTLIVTTVFAVAFVAWLSFGTPIGRAIFEAFIWAYTAFIEFIGG